VKAHILAGMVIVALGATVVAVPDAMAFDEKAAKALAKRNDCFKCHAVDKTKKGPSYKKIAAKYKDKPDAEAKMNEQVTKEHKVKLEDGTEETHKVIDTQDAAEIKNLLDWIRAQ
jgi:cytochrome c